MTTRTAIGRSWPRAAVILLVRRFRHPWAYVLMCSIAAALWLGIAGPSIESGDTRDHVVLLDAGHLLMAADAPESAALFRSMGYAVTEVDVSEFEKLEGCVTCLSVRHRG